jgi:4-amino-4-deoxy-L-arabinose transferase-like glycosyltransferase
MATIYPYYVAHDTAHQETVLFTFLTAAAVYCLVRARGSGSLRDHLLAGWWIGLGLLCKESMLPLVPLAMLWLYFASSAGKGHGSRARIGALLMVVTIVVVPWLIRNALIYGKPVFTTGEGFGPGFHLWAGYNEFTLTHYPWDSIDKSVAAAYEALSSAERAELSRLGELDSDHWFFQRALAFIKQNPATALKYAVIKVIAGFSPIISPTVGNWLRAVLYTISYLPILVLAIVGGILTWKRWRTLSIFYLLFLSFIGVTVVAHAHTSHRSYLDVYLMILASHALVWLLPKSTHAARRVFAPLPG